MRKDKAHTILISRTDSLGDVMLTLPIAGFLKKQDPSCRILFLGRNYSRPIIQTCKFVDEFISWDEIKELPPAKQLEFFSALQADAILHVFPEKNIAALAFRAKIPMRIGTSHRLFHLLSCNKLVHFTRRNSMLHEAQLNFKLLAPLGYKVIPPLSELSLFSGFSPKRSPGNNSNEIFRLLSVGKFNLILHPRSKGSAREWGLDNFRKLIDLLPADQFRIFISGTKEEGDSMQELINACPQAYDLTGKLSLENFIDFIAAADGLIAASTGPLHIAAALGKVAIGIYAPMHPIDPGRWGPLGPHAQALVIQRSCSDCRKTQNCHCIREIKPEQILGCCIKEIENQEGEASEF
jgi:heptosyltransferase-3